MFYRNVSTNVHHICIHGRTPPLRVPSRVRPSSNLPPLFSSSILSSLPSSLRIELLYPLNLKCLILQAFLSVPVTVMPGLMHARTTAFAWKMSWEGTTLQFTEKTSARPLRTAPPMNSGTGMPKVSATRCGVALMFTPRKMATTAWKFGSMVAIQMRMYPNQCQRLTHQLLLQHPPTGPVLLLQSWSLSLWL